ncbi:MAG: terminase [Alphaproteobacteria bacterium]
MQVHELDAATLGAVKDCQYDPDQWSKFAWDWGHGELAEIEGTRGWQEKVDRKIRDHLKDPKTRFQPLQIAVASGHGVGKSAKMGQLANWAMSCFVDAKVVVTANTSNQLATKTAPEFSKWFRLAINAHWFDVQATSIKTKDPKHRDSWRCDFVPWSDHNTEAFAGLHNKNRIILLMFDEASKISDKVWEVAEGALTDENTIIIWIVFGNPTRNSGRFRECFRRWRHRWWTMNIDSRDVPGTNKKKIEEWVNDHGEDSDFVKVRVKGEFPAQTALQFISAEDADAARAAMARLKEPMISFAPRILGVDPAWTGDDSFEIMLRQGLYSKSLRSIPRNDDDFKMASMIAQLEDELQIDAVFVDAGYGTGIVSCGRALGRTWHLVWFSSKPNDPGYLNKRAEIWGEMKAWLKAGGCIDPKDTLLYDDIIGPETVPRADGKKQLESKEDMKDRGIPSPNRGDALALTFSAPVSKKEHVPASGQVRHKVDYDPFNSVSDDIQR